MYLVYRYNQYRRQQQEANKRKAAERELNHLNHKIDKLLSKLDEHEPELAMCQEEECVICVHAKATMQTFPCSHRVVCRKCFVKTIQVAVKQRLLPLRCVVCRAKIVRLRQSKDPVFPTSISQYSMEPYENPPGYRVVPSSHSLYSFTSGSSGYSEVSNVSSGSSESASSYRSYGRNGKGYRAQSHTPVIKKVKVSSGARNKEPVRDVPQIRIESYDCLPIRLSPTGKGPRSIIRENKVAPQDIGNRLPTIRECTELIPEKDAETEKSSSTRIRCAQKLVSQLEAKNKNMPEPVTFRPISTPVPTRRQVEPIKNPTPTAVFRSQSMPSPSSKCALIKSSTEQKFQKSSKNSISNDVTKRNLAKGYAETSLSKQKTKRRDSSTSSSSLKSSYSSTNANSSQSSKSMASVKSGVSNNSSVSTRSGASSYKSTTSSKSSLSSVSTVSTVTVKSYRAATLSKKGENKKVKTEPQMKIEDAMKHKKQEITTKSQKKKIEGKQYHRLQ